MLHWQLEWGQQLYLTEHRYSNSNSPSLFSAVSTEKICTRGSNWSSPLTLKLCNFVLLHSESSKKLHADVWRYCNVMKLISLKSSLLFINLPTLLRLTENTLSLYRCLTFKLHFQTQSGRGRRFRSKNRSWWITVGQWRDYRSSQAALCACWVQHRLCEAPDRT